MPRRVLLPIWAERWLHREVSYLAERNVSAARRLLDRIEDARRQLAAFPEAADLASFRARDAWLSPPVS